MHVIAILILSSLFAVMPMENSDKPNQAPFVGRYCGTSAFTPTNPADSGYADSIPVWFIFELDSYVYGEGETIPDDLYGDGGGPYEWTDSTVTLNGVYPKILRPIIVLRGTFGWRLEEDTLTLTQPADTATEVQHRLRLVRQ